MKRATVSDLRPPPDLAQQLREHARQTVAAEARQLLAALILAAVLCVALDYLLWLAATWVASVDRVGGWAAAVVFSGIVLSQIGMLVNGVQRWAEMRRAGR